MLRVVIVDDEPVLVRSLQTMIERSDCDMEVVGAANDGINGLAMIRERMPDLVFVDISMPVMDGLQLITHLRQENNDVSVVILSGYKEFDYAKRAVALDVEEYLVKPVNPVDFRSFLKNVSRKIRNERYEKIHTQLNLAMRNPKINLPGWVQPLRFDCWKICFGVFSYYRKMGVDAEGENLRGTLLTVLKKYCRGNDVWLSETRYPNEFNLFLTTANEDDSRIRAIYDACRENLPSQTVTVALGGRSLGAAELRIAAKKANAILQSGAVFASSSFLTKEESPGHYSKQELAAICDLLRRGETAKVSRLLQQGLRKWQESACTQADLAVILKQILQGCRKEDLQLEADYHAGILLEQSNGYEELLKNVESLLFQTSVHNEFIFGIIIIH